MKSVQLYFEVEWMKIVSNLNKIVSNLNYFSLEIRPCKSTVTKQQFGKHKIRIYASNCRAIKYTIITLLQIHTDGLKQLIIRVFLKVSVYSEVIITGFFDDLSTFNLKLFLAVTFNIFEVSLFCVITKPLHETCFGNKYIKL